MTRGQRAAIENYARRNFSVQMIQRMMSRAGVTLKSPEIRAVISDAGLVPLDDYSSDRGFRITPSERQQYEDPDTLRARWAGLLPNMRKRLRAQI